MRKKILILLFLFYLLFNSKAVYAQDNGQSAQNSATLEAVIEKILIQKEVKVAGTKKQIYQKLELVVTKGSSPGQHLTVENGNIPISNEVVYKVGDQVVVTIPADPDGTGVLYISDYVRRTPVYVLFIIFIVLSVLIGRERGLTALFGMGISFLVIFRFILPQILAGWDPIMVVIFASLVIVPITFYISHGLNRKTTAAIIGTLVSISITGILAGAFVQSAKLTGTASEEASYLALVNRNAINFQGLLFASILIAVLGILNDVTISQSAIVAQLKQVSQTFSFQQLYFRAMSVGKDHIASMINTLILVYVGGALPLLLLFVNTSRSFWNVINYEIVAEEIVKTLVVSSGLILAVPITTLIACIFVTKDDNDLYLPHIQIRKTTNNARPNVPTER